MWQDMFCYTAGNFVCIRLLRLVCNQGAMLKAGSAGAQPGEAPGGSGSRQRRQHRQPRNLHMLRSVAVSDGVLYPFPAAELLCTPCLPLQAPQCA